MRRSPVSTILPLLCVFLPLVDAQPPGSGWTKCANEHGACTFSGTQEIGYGVDTFWKYETHTGSVACKNYVFGDPKPGRAKACYRRTPTNSISLNVNDQKQTISLMGADMERSAHALVNHAGNPQTIANWIFKDIDFDVCRLSFDRKQELTEGSPNWSFYDAPIKAMKYVKKARSNVKFMAVLKSDYDGFGKVNNLPDWIYTGGGYNGGNYEPSKLDVVKYARFLADFLKHMNNNGVPIGILSVSKEWVQVVDAQREVETVAEIKRLLKTKAYQGVPEPDFVGPSSWGVTQATSFLRRADDVDDFSAVATHSYNQNNAAAWNALIAEAKQNQLPVWHTESTLGSCGSCQGKQQPMSRPIKALLSHCLWYRAGIHGEIFFEVWSRNNSRETRAVQFLNGSNGVRFNEYYIMQLFANEAKGSRYITSSTSGLDGVDTMAFRDGKSVILWVINSSTNTYSSVSIPVNGSSVDKASALTWYDESEVDGTNTSAKVSGGTIQLTIRAESIVAILIDLD